MLIFFVIQCHYFSNPAIFLAIFSFTLITRHVMACNLESHTIAIKYCFGMQQPHVQYFLWWQGCFTQVFWWWNNNTKTRFYMDDFLKNYFVSKMIFLNILQNIVFKYFVFHTFWNDVLQDKSLTTRQIKFPCVAWFYKKCFWHQS